MWRFKLTQQAQRILGVHAAVYNVFNLACYLALYYSHEFVDLSNARLRV